MYTYFTESHHITKAVSYAIFITMTTYLLKCTLMWACMQTCQKRPSKYTNSRHIFRQHFDAYNNWLTAAM